MVMVVALLVFVMVVILVVLVVLKLWWWWWGWGCWCFSFPKSFMFDELSSPHWLGLRSLKGRQMMDQMATLRMYSCFASNSCIPAL